MKSPAEVWYPAVGHCIYCKRTPAELEAAGEKPLHPEHIVPYSFGGHWVLDGASCQTCADTTAALEGACCATMFKALRVHHNIQTRRPKNRPKTIAVREGETPQGGPLAEVSVDEAPGVVAFPVLSPPGIFLGHEPSKTAQAGFTWMETTEDHGERQKKLMEARGGGVLAHVGFDLWKFLRVLAKIAHAYDMSQVGRTETDYSLVPYIDGSDDHLPFIVGGTAKEYLPNYFPNEEPPKSGSLHQIFPVAISICGVGYICAQIRLFAYLRPSPPVYTVVMRKRPIPKGDFHFVIEEK